MKNILIIDCDTEREFPMQIRKPIEVEPPATPEEARIRLIQDIETAFNGLLTLTGVAVSSGYLTKELVVKTMHEKFSNYNYENKTKESLEKPE